MRNIEVFDDDDPFAADGGGDHGGAIELDLPDPPSHAPPVITATAEPGARAELVAEAPTLVAPGEPRPPLGQPARPDAESLPPILAPALAGPKAQDSPDAGGEGAGPSSSRTAAGGDTAARTGAGAALIARYPAPPEKLWKLPEYAGRVLLRQFELRQDLVSLRRRRSPDVPLYEAALRAYEPKAFQTGLLLGLSAFVLLGLVVFSPVIVRFASN